MVEERGQQERRSCVVTVGGPESLRGAARKDSEEQQVHPQFM
jgi:hypothetical protein